MTAPAPRVYRMDEVCRVLQISRTTLKRQRRLGLFPIPECESLDRHPRWAVDAVEAWLLKQQPVAARGAHRRQSRRFHLVQKGHTS